MGGTRGGFLHHAVLLDINRLCCTHTSRWNVAAMNSRVLLVEDNPDDEALAIRALKRCGSSIEIEIARDGAEALRYLGIDGDRYDGRPLPDLTLLDIKLPKINGLDVLRAIRASELTANLHVVMLTSSDEPSDVSAASTLNSSKYVRKPIDYCEYMNALQEVVSEFIPCSPA